MQLIVCGSRDLRDRWIVEAMLGAFYMEGLTDRTGKLVLYEGGQRKANGAGIDNYIGADWFACCWAKYKIKQLSERGMKPTSFEHVQTPAEWEKYRGVGAHGNPAGFIRNGVQLQKMLDRWRPGDPVYERALALGFVNKPREESPGTHHMLGLCENAGVPTFTIDTRKGFWHVQEAARRASEQ